MGFSECKAEGIEIGDKVIIDADDPCSYPSEGEVVEFSPNRVRVKILTCGNTIEILSYRITKKEVVNEGD